MKKTNYSVIHSVKEKPEDADYFIANLDWSEGSEYLQIITDDNRLFIYDMSTSQIISK